MDKGYDPSRPEAHPDYKIVQDMLRKAMEKLKAAYEAEPDSPDITLTTQEAVLVYRLLIEKA